jgi:retinol-binding protein 3
MLAFVLLATLLDPRRVVTSVAANIESRYVLAAEAKTIAAELRERAAAGKYDNLDAQRLAAQLTQELREKDLHFDVQYQRKAETPAQMRRANHGFRRVELLEGNVALIEIDHLDDLERSRKTIEAAMTFVAAADAVILDLRGAPGGYGNTVRFLASHFVPAGTPLMASFSRETGKTTRDRSMRTNVQLHTQPLFVAVGPVTGSAAEALAFTLQRIGRATIVGERSLGAAHGGGWVEVGDGFEAYIPTFRAFDPKTNEGWQGTGVIPELKSGQAAAAAHLAAIRAIAPNDRWLIALLELEANGPGTATLVPGRYEGIEIREDHTFLGASGIPRRLIPLHDGTFLIEDTSVSRTVQARLRFVEGGLELLVADGRAIKRARIP